MVRNPRGLGWLGRIIALVVIGGVYAGVMSYVFLTPAPTPYVAPIAENGDFVGVDYRGWFPDNLKTFDTSVAAFARLSGSAPSSASAMTQADRSNPNRARPRRASAADSSPVAS